MTMITPNRFLMTPRLADALRAWFGDALYQRDGVAYPFVIYPASRGTPPDDLLGTYTPKDDADFALYDAAHLAHRRATREVTNGLCYRATTLTHAPLRLDGVLGHYFDMLATCDALTEELRAYERAERDDLPLRESLHAHISPTEILHNGAGRSAVIGAATLTVYRDQDDYHALVVERNQRVATGAGRLHVFPAFIFQPNLDADAEWSLKAQVLREFGEELFGVPEFHAWTPTPTTPDYFMDAPPVRDLAEMLADGRAELHATGIVQNLLSTRFELCTLLVIHDADWRVRHAEALAAAMHTERQATYPVSLTTLEGLPEDWQARFVPQGLAAFFLGLDAWKG